MGDASRANVFVDLLQQDATLTGDPPVLHVETSDSANGPWTDIVTTLAAPPDDTVFSLARAADGQNRLRQYLRWRIDGLSDDVDTVKTLCFTITVTLR